MPNIFSFRKYIKLCIAIGICVNQVLIQKFTASPYTTNKNTENDFIPNLSILDMISFLNKDQILNNLERSNQWVKYIN